MGIGYSLYYGVKNMIKKQVKYNYSAFDVVALLTVLLNTDSKYFVNYNKDTSQIVIKRQTNNKETN